MIKNGISDPVFFYRKDERVKGSTHQFVFFVKVFVRQPKLMANGFCLCFCKNQWSMVDNPR